jgi:thioredoxin-related protein
MKKIVLLLAFLIRSLVAEPKLTDIFDAYDDASSQNKNVIIMLSMEGCSVCEYMKDIVFEDKKVEKLLNNFVLVELDVRADSIPENLKYFATPTFYFLDSNEKILKRVNGGKNVVDFTKILKKMKK